MTHRRLLVVVLFLVVFSFDLARPTDIDFWWHLKTGELIAHSGAVPRTDPFSYTAFGQPWVVHEWLWELITFFVYRQGGYALAVLLSAVLVTLTYVLLYRLLRQLGVNEILSAVLVLWAAALALPNLGVRPREVTHLFVVVFLSQLLRQRERHGGHLWILPPVMLLWVNLHGGFVLGLGLLVLFIIGGAGEWWLSAGESPRPLLTVGLVTVAAACINPGGPRMLLYPFTYYSQNDNPSFRIVTEFQSPNFHEPLMLLFAAGMVLFIILGIRRDRPRVLDGLLAAVFTVQALVSARQVATCALVMAPLLGLVLCERFRWAGELRPVRLPRQFIVLNWALLVVLVVAGIAYAARPRLSAKLQLRSEPIPGPVPVAGAQFIEDQHLPAPVFNHQPWGGYLVYRWYPQRRVFIDGRIDMYGPTIVGDYVRIANVQPGWAEALEKYGVRTILIPKDSPLSLLLLEGQRWQRVFQGEIEDVFVRKEDAQAPQ
jgi:hypothetical protein